jgi:hypothetical protein
VLALVGERVDEPDVELVGNDVAVAGIPSGPFTADPAYPCSLSFGLPSI